MPMHPTESVKELTRLRDRRRKLGGLLIVPERPERPRTRADCAGGARPCPWVSCKHHLFLEVRATGTISYPQGTDVAALERMPQSCALDVAEAGGASQTEVGEHLNVSMQMASLIEQAALAKLTLAEGIDEFW